MTSNEQPDSVLQEALETLDEAKAYLKECKDNRKRQEDHVQALNQLLSKALRDRVEANNADAASPEQLRIQSDDRAQAFVEATNAVNEAERSLARRAEEVRAAKKDVNKANARVDQLRRELREEKKAAMSRPGYAREVSESGPDPSSPGRERKPSMITRISNFVMVAFGLGEHVADDGDESDHDGHVHANSGLDPGRSGLSTGIVLHPARSPFGHDGENGVRQRHRSLQLVQGRDDT